MNSDERNQDVRAVWGEPDDEKLVKVEEINQKEKSAYGKRKKR